MRGNMLKLDEETKRILLEIAGLFGYLGLGLTLWQLTMNAPLMFAYGLFILCILLLLRYRRVNRKLTQLQEKLSAYGQSTEELQLVKGLFEGMLGLWLYSTEYPTSDTKHHFTSFHEEYIIHGDNGIYNWLLRGYNTLDEPSHVLTLKLTGDTPIDTSSLSLSVVDNCTGQRYHDKQIRVVKDLPYLKILDIVFPKPIEKDECFDLRIGCRWDNTFPRSRRYDYVFFPFGHYAAKGIDQSFVRLVCDVHISDFALHRLEAGRLIKERAQPKIVDTSRRHFTLEWEIANPQHVYILRFTKEIEDVSRTPSTNSNGSYELSRF
jgi:hypothetical protein